MASIHRGLSSVSSAVPVWYFGGLKRPQPAGLFIYFIIRCQRQPGPRSDLIPTHASRRQKEIKRNYWPN
jgi:hypothetical protein